MYSNKFKIFESNKFKKLLENEAAINWYSMKRTELSLKQVYRKPLQFQIFKLIIDSRTPNIYLTIYCRANIKWSPWLLILGSWLLHSDDRALHVISWQKNLFPPGGDFSPPNTYSYCIIFNVGGSRVHNFCGYVQVRHSQNTAPHQQAISLLPRGMLKASCSSQHKTS